MDWDQYHILLVLSLGVFALCSFIAIFLIIFCFVKEQKKREAELNPPPPDAHLDETSTSYKISGMWNFNNRVLLDKNSDVYSDVDGVFTTSNV